MDFRVTFIPTTFSPTSGRVPIRCGLVCVQVVVEAPDAEKAIANARQWVGLYADNWSVTMSGRAEKSSARPSAINEPHREERT